MSEITLRPARPADEAAVTALSSHIWEGEDYVPRRFSDWVADERGQFTVACDRDTLVGFGKLTELAPGEWWLEGLRVHPDHRGRGIARKLHHHAVDLAATIGRGVLRFATSGRNEAVHKLARETGFHRVAAYHFASLATGEGLDTGQGLDIDEGHGRHTGHFAPAAPADLPTIEEWLQTSELFDAVGGLFEEHWKWKSLLPRLSALRAENRLYWWLGDNGRRAGLVVVLPEEENVLRLNYLDAAPDALHNLCRKLPALARRLDRAQIKARPPAVAPLPQALEAAGWELEPDVDMWVFERPL